MLRLAEDYRVLAPDLRGWGWSDAPRDDYAKATFAADILALMDAERLDRVSLLGHDWGGYTSFLLSLEHRERIERMIALDVTPPWLGRLQARHLAAPLMGSYQALLATPILGPATMTSGNGFIRRFIRYGSGPAMRWSDDELDVYAGVLREPRRANASSACYRSFLTRELPASLLGGHAPDDLDVPALLVMGEDSPIRRILDPQPSRNLRVERIGGLGTSCPRRRLSGCSSSRSSTSPTRDCAFGGSGSASGMWLFSRLWQTYLVGRLLGVRRRRAARRAPLRRGRPRCGRAGFFGPFAAYSKRTRGGSRVTVSGCCLPIPLALAATAAVGARALLRC